MARFSLRRPSDFFRRNKSADGTAVPRTTSTAGTVTTATTTTDTTPSSPKPSPSTSNNVSSSQSTPVRLKKSRGEASSSSRKPKKSASLSRLRERVVSTQQGDVEDEPAPIPTPPSPGTAARLELQRKSNLAALEKSNPTSSAGVATATSTPSTELPPSEASRSLTSPSPHLSARDLLVIDRSEETATTFTGKPKPQVRFGEASKREHQTVQVNEVRLSEELGRDEGGIPVLVLERHTPDATTGVEGQESLTSSTSNNLPDRALPLRLASITSQHTIDDLHIQTLVDSTNDSIVPVVLDSPIHSRTSPAVSEYLSLDSNSVDRHITIMPQRKIWVRRPGASATLVQVREGELVDDARDTILRKYANSLGKAFDSPDVVLRIIMRDEHDGSRERILGPEEELCRTLDAHYPGGQNVAEALIIDVPQKRTPRPSPMARSSTYHQVHNNGYTQSFQVMEDLRPPESGSDYFPPMPTITQSNVPQTSISHDSRSSHHTQPSQNALGLGTHPHHLPAMSVLSTGQVPPLPSPGAAGRRHQGHRPKLPRQHTSSPTIVQHHNPGAAAIQMQAPQGAVIMPAQHAVHGRGNRVRHDSTTSEHHPNLNGALMNNNSLAPNPPPLPTPPAPEAGPGGKPSSNPSTPGGAQIAAQHSKAVRPKKNRRNTPDHSRSRSQRSMDHSANGVPNLSNVLDASVPPINVLIVEDNIINLRILEGLMKRLKVRWQTAMNGKIALDKWKAGGFHLVLMDIQMPIMNGLQATKEIRRLERVNGIGVFSSSALPSPSAQVDKADTTMNGNSKKDKQSDAENDRLSLAEGLFKSPVIIVALTASSLQSDRREALAAGCNDFLTKPVNFVWLERKVKEWGCMQALIDFDGWRKWKEYATKEEEGKSEEQKAKERAEDEKQKKKAEKMAKLQEITRKKEEQRKAARRQSVETPTSGTNGTTDASES